MSKLVEKELHPKDEIQDLVIRINHHNELYHTVSDTEISDFDYDLLVNRLKILEEQFPQYVLPNSPIHKVGAPLERYVRGEKHIRPMLSLTNTYSEDDIDDFLQRISKILEISYVDIYCELKVDGVAASLIYERGKLVRALTRGDGEYGENIMDAVRTIKSIPQSINQMSSEDEFEVRGEIYIGRKDFEELNAERAASGEVLWANARNLASGTLKVLDIDTVAQRRLSFTPYSFFMNEKGLKTQMDSINLLASMGFYIPETSQKCENKEQVLSYIYKWEKERLNLDYNTDGVVLKVNSFEYQQKMGASAHSPRWAVAYKYKPESAKTKLIDVVFQIGRTGAITPVAILEPVFIAGTTVQRASLYNKEHLDRINLHYGDTVFVEKGGDVIPKLSGVELSLRPPEAKKIYFPLECPKCNAKIVQHKGEATYYCSNKKCEPQLKAAFTHFVSRHAMDIESMGKKTIDVLYNEGLLKSFADIYKLQYDDIIGLPGFKKQASDKLLESIAFSKRQPMHKLIFAMGIKHVGVVAAEALASSFKSFDKIMDSSIEQLTAIDDIGSRTAKAVVEYFQDQDNVREIIELGKFGLPMQISGSSEQVKTLFSEKTFVITGSFETLTRDQMTDLIKKHGGKVLSSISSNTDFLVVGANPTETKLTRSIISNVKNISESELRAMII